MDQEKHELWKKRIQHYRSSGLTGASWCKEQGIPENQLWYWKKKCEEAPTKEKAAPTWAPVIIEDPAPYELALTVRIGTMEIEVKPGYDATLLQDVVQTLMSLC